MMLSFEQRMVGEHFWDQTTSQLRNNFLKILPQKDFQIFKKNHTQFQSYLKHLP